MSIALVETFNLNRIRTFTNQSLNIGQQTYVYVKPLTQFEGHRYIALETFKHNGEGVKTTVWFVEEGGKLYIWTPSKSRKAKRIRNNPKVRFATSTARGTPKSEWSEGEAQILNPSDSTRPTELIRRKYGVQFWFVSNLHGRNRIIIKLETKDRA